MTVRAILGMRHSSRRGSLVKATSGNVPVRPLLTTERTEEHQEARLDPAPSPWRFPIGPKYILPVVSALCNVMQHSGDYDAGYSRHDSC
jgi:hypothetical protein